VYRTIRDIAVERARIGLARIAHRLPIGAAAHRIDGCRNVWRTARCLLLFQVNPSLNSLIFVSYERPEFPDLYKPHSYAQRNFASHQKQA
jgi:hypothetical protein